MLVVQPSSTCDVCLERYAWDAPASELLSKPHVITCGHVFCHQCLQNLRTPRTCPLCRAAFHLTRAIRVHVDLATDDNSLRMLTPEEAQARLFELRLAKLLSSSDASQPREEVTASEDAGPTEGEETQIEAGRDDAVMDEARTWLEDMPPDSHPILRTLLDTVAAGHSLSSSYQTIQEEITRMRGERDQLRRYLRRSERQREQEAALAKNAEKVWLVKMSEVERDCELKLTQAETERQRLDEELSRLNLALKDAHDAQSDILVQAHLQIREQAQNSASAPPYPQPKNAVSTSTSTMQQPQAGPSSGIAFPRSSTSPPHSTSAFDSDSRSTFYDFDFPHSRNPLPRPPEPVPLSRLPAFARPRPGSSAYTAAKALARHAHGSSKEEKDKERSERRKEKERMTDGEREKRERRRREKVSTGTDSGATGNERRRARAGKERDRGTDTSATETQERERRTRTRHASLVGTFSSHDHASFSDAPLANGAIYMKGPATYPMSQTATAERAGEVANGSSEANVLPVLPRDVVGGWGLERSWRASLASNTSGASASASREDLHDDFREASAFGSSHTKLRVRGDKDKGDGEEKKKGKGKERESRRDEEEGNDVKDEYVFVSSAHDVPSLSKREDPNRERHVSFSAYPTVPRDTTDELPRLQPQSQAQTETQRERERERRTTLSVNPSALGLVLVPSPDGRGGYTYEYQYQHPYRPPVASASASQSTNVQVVSAPKGTNTSEKESVTPVASQFRNTAADQNQSRDAGYGTLTRRATDSTLQAQAPTSRQSRAPSRNATNAAPLHIPQPRRISLTIPDPDDLSPQLETSKAHDAKETQQSSFRNDNTAALANQSHGYFNGHAYQNASYAQHAGGLYANTKPNANMSLDSALASLSLAAGSGPGPDTSSSSCALATTAPSVPVPVPGKAGTNDGQQSLRHRTSNSSTASASTGISLTGVTSGERRKQLLDALFSDSDPGASTEASNRSSFASNGDENGNPNPKRMSIGRALDTAAASAAVNGDSTRGAGTSTNENLVPAPAPAPATRGVPSRDGRPSRGLSSSIRPSTTQPFASHGMPSYAPPSQPQPTSSSHVRQATYATPTYTAQPSYAPYQAQHVIPTAYAVYPAYYQHPQSQAQAQVQQMMVNGIPTGRFDYRAQAPMAGAAADGTPTRR